MNLSTSGYPINPANNPRAMAVGSAIGVYIDQLGIRQDVTYLVFNGIDPHEAVARVLAYRRRGVVWGLAAVPVLFWGGLFTGYGLREGIPGLFFRGTSVMATYAGLACLALGVTMSYLLVMSHFWSWRRCAAGVPWEDSRNPFFPSRRPKELRVTVEGQPLDAGRKFAAYAILGFASLLWFGPVLSGAVQGLGKILGGL